MYSKSSKTSPRLRSRTPKLSSIRVRHNSNEIQADIGNSSKKHKLRHKVPRRQSASHDTDSGPTHSQSTTRQRNLSSTSSINSNEKDFEIHANRRYQLDDGRIGVCQFFGKTLFASGFWVGLSMELGEGNTNGTVYGKKYFSCRDGKGLFVRADKIIADLGSSKKTLSDFSEMDYITVLTPAFSDSAVTPLSVSVFNSESPAVYIGSVDEHSIDTATSTSSSHRLRQPTSVNSVRSSGSNSPRYLLAHRSDYHTFDPNSYKKSQRRRQRKKNRERENTVLKTRLRKAMLHAHNKSNNHSESKSKSKSKSKRSRNRNRNRNRNLNADDDDDDEHHHRKRESTTSLPPERNRHRKQRKHQKKKQKQRERERERETNAKQKNNPHNRNEERTVLKKPLPFRNARSHDMFADHSDDDDDDESYDRVQDDIYNENDNENDNDTYPYHEGGGQQNQRAISIRGNPNVRFRESVHHNQSRGPEIDIDIDFAMHIKVKRVRSAENSPAQDFRMHGFVLSDEDDSGEGSGQDNVAYMSDKVRRSNAHNANSADYGRAADIFADSGYEGMEGFRGSPMPDRYHESNDNMFEILKLLLKQGQSQKHVVQQVFDSSVGKHKGRKHKERRRKHKHRQARALRSRRKKRKPAKYHRRRPRQKKPRALTEINIASNADLDEILGINVFDDDDEDDSAAESDSVSSDDRTLISNLYSEYEDDSTNSESDSFEAYSDESSSGCSAHSDSILNDDEFRLRKHRQRQASMASSMADALTISALLPVKNRMLPFIAREKWKPANFDVEPDHGAFLKPKLLHSKKDLDSHQHRSVPRKLGPKEIGRIKGFHSPVWAASMTTGGGAARGRFSRGGKSSLSSMQMSMFAPSTGAKNPYHNKPKSANARDFAANQRGLRIISSREDTHTVLNAKKQKHLMTFSRTPNAKDIQNTSAFSFSSHDEQLLLESPKLADARPSQPPPQAPPPSRVTPKPKPKPKPARKQQRKSNTAKKYPRNSKTMKERHQRSQSTLLRRSMRNKVKVKEKRSVRVNENINANSKKRTRWNADQQEWLEDNLTWIPPQSNHGSHSGKVVRKLGPRDIGRIHGYKGTKLKPSAANIIDSPLLLESSTTSPMNNSVKVQKKLGPRQIGRMTDFHSPVFVDDVEHNNLKLKHKQKFKFKPHRISLPNLKQRKQKKQTPKKKKKKQKTPQPQKKMKKKRSAFHITRKLGSSLTPIRSPNFHDDADNKESTFHSLSKSIQSKFGAQTKSSQKRRPKKSKELPARFVLDAIDTDSLPPPVLLSSLSSPLSSKLISAEPEMNPLTPMSPPPPETGAVVKKHNSHSLVVSSNMRALSNILEDSDMDESEMDARVETTPTSVIIHSIGSGLGITPLPPDIASVSQTQSSATSFHSKHIHSSKRRKKSSQSKQKQKQKKPKKKGSAVSAFKTLNKEKRSLSVTSISSLKKLQTKKKLQRKKIKYQNEKKRRDKIRAKRLKRQKQYLLSQIKN